ncbi:TcpQ domain-containing protein [Superficieibacter sp.]|uniref:TcpQ domain-containing protein n=1 Tax=Superficieibacter sp. TaxID=2303322 RepID=UPI0028AA46FC|nr:TcpQ domain-containing protein [Superficieibacter sp.]
MKKIKSIILVGCMSCSWGGYAAETVELVSETAGISSAAPRNPFSAGREVTTTQGALNVASANVTLDLIEGELLSQQLKTWAEKNGFKVLWNSSHDYLIYKSIHMTERDKDTVLLRLGELFTSENYGLVIKYFQKNSVLVIDEQ